MSMPRLDRVAGGSPAPRHRHFPAQYLFALLAGCLFNLSHLLRLVRARDSFTRSPPPRVGREDLVGGVLYTGMTY